MHARLVEHSEFEMHSGRQLGGVPINSRRHEQDGESPIGRHSELAPHGDGLHGSIGSLGGGGCSTAIRQKSVIG